MDKTSNDVKKNLWICCQIGAREHYFISRELQSAGELELLITDYWATHDGSSKILNQFNKNLGGRMHDEIPTDKVVSFNLSSIFFELSTKMTQVKGWDAVINRNQWFQKKTIAHLKNLKKEPTHIFSYSYAAKDIFKYAKSRGWRTVLGQIDPGPAEEEVVLNELSTFPAYQSEWQPAPVAYWEKWYEECELADTIIVNSDWSYQALLQKGIAKSKVKIVPLSYTTPDDARSFQRIYPSQLNRDRPLRILILGQVILRKGIARIVEAARLLTDKPVEFIIAGPIGIYPLPQLPNVKWVGRVSRLEVNEYFKKADIFLFPTLSDGFGLTQLEARAWKLPLIVSRNCGTVIKDQYDGWILNEASARAIVKTILDILQNPEIMSTFSANISNQVGVDFQSYLAEA